MEEFWNPNTWSQEHEHRIYLDDRAALYVVVDAEDYSYFSQWKWHVNELHPRRNGTKRYACRSQSNGRRSGPKLYLHVEIMRRTGVLPPTPAHRLVDHRDGDEFNCRRVNLRWATVRMNNLNKFGQFPFDLLDRL